MERTTPIALTARAAAVFGAVLWVLAALYCLLVITSGFVSWDAPNPYVTALLVVFGLALNEMLFRGAKGLRPLAALGLTLISLALSAIVVGIIIYLALDLAQT